jgi:hypothetical protein
MNVQRMISNQKDLGDIESRSGDLKNIAFNVRNNADQLRKEASRRNIRIMIIIGLVSVAVIASIIIGVSS